MNYSEEAIRLLADRMGWDQEENPERLRARVEESLVPMIRCALRSGRGAPALVQWVRRRLPEAAPAPRPVDPARVAPEMARELCAALLRQLQARRASPAAETVVGR